MSKYRVKLKNSRIIGPLKVEQIKELFEKGHIDLSEKAHEFPYGQWEEIKKIEKLSSFLLGKEESLSEPIEEVEDLQIPDLDYQDDLKETEIDYEELERNYQEELEKEKELELELKKNEADRTRLVKVARNVNVEKTLIINPGKDLSGSINNEEKKEEDRKDDLPIKDEFSEEEKTVFFNVEKIKEDLKKEAKKFEIEIASKKKENLDEDVEEINQEIEEESEKAKKMRPMIALVFLLLIIYLALPDEEEKVKGFVPMPIKITFPTPLKEEDRDESRRLFTLGVKSFKRNTYDSKLKAAKLFRKSLGHKFKGNKSLGYLIWIYADLFENDKDRRRATKTIFKLLELARVKLYKDDKVALGSSLFYQKINKHYTAISIIENYLKLNQPTTQLFASYLDALMAGGSLVKARKVYDRLKKVKKKNLNVILAMNNYLITNEKFDDSFLFLKNNSQKYQSNVAFLLAYAETLVRKEDFKSLTRTLQLIRELKSEGSPFYYSMFLEKMGILSAYLGEVKKASYYFNLSLKIKEDRALRERLAQLELGGDRLTEFLIRESKIKELIRQAKVAEKNYKWEKVVRLAVKASDLDDTNIRAQVYLSKVQIRRGYYSLAISTLERILEEYPLNRNVNRYLFQAYIKSFKFERAKELLSSLARTKFSETSVYHLMLSQYYRSIGNYVASSRSYTNALKLDPLNDQTYAEVTDVYIKLKNYKLAKKRIQKAIILDPQNVDYRLKYAEILYLTEDVEIAISYLLDLLESHQDHPALLGKIAYYYYSNQESDNYSDTKKKLLKLTHKDPTFYYSMIKSAELEGRVEAVIQNSKKLLELEPGDLKVRMNLAEVYFQNGKFKESLEELAVIKERLESYPKLNYLISKIYISTGEFQKALEIAELEVKFNPRSEFGYFAKGEALRKLKNYPDARKEFERSVALNGKYVEALMGLGWIKLYNRYYEDARELYSRALRQEPDNPIIHRQLGFIYRSSGQSKLSIDSFRKYLTLRPNAKDKAEVERIIKHLQ